MGGMTARVLPADVYDALELSALVYGGIGAGWYYWPPMGVSPGEEIPHCIFGHADACDGEVIQPALMKVGIDTVVNDDAVHAVQKRKPSMDTPRITFKQWCKELGVVRGAA
jgi:hypothetical protein